MEHYFDNIDGWFNFQDIYETAVHGAPEGAVLLEIGAYYGKSTAFMGVEIINSRKNLKFYTVDTFEGSAEHKNPDDPAYNPEIAEKGSIYDSFIKNIEPVKSVVTPIKSTSIEASKQFEDQSIDFVFIDGSHQFGDVLEDLKHWYPKVKRGGILAGHDINWPDVQDALNLFFGYLAKYVQVSRTSWIWEK